MAFEFKSRFTGDFIDYGSWGSNHYSVMNSRFESIGGLKNPGPPYKSGGGMVLKRTSFKHSCSGSLTTHGFFTDAMNLQFYSNVFGDTKGKPVLPTWSTDTSVNQAKAWRKFRPGNPTASTGQAIIELRQIPTLPLKQILKARSTVQFARAAGSEYLNLDFGWRLFVNDLRDLVKGIQTIDKQLAQLRRDNGRTIRRRGVVSKVEDPTTVVEVTGGHYQLPALVSAMYLPTTRRQTTVTTSHTHTWFSGAFRYFVKDISSPQFTRRATAALFGSLPTPSLLWEVLPWTWMIDWAVNVGDVLSNASPNAVDNLVAHYAYLMEEKEITTTVYSNDLYKRGSFDTVGQEINVVDSKTQVTKVREAASPFGFGLVPGNLSGHQALILSALGISRHW